MNEILEKLLNSEILNDESKKELEEAFKTTLDEAVAVAVAEAKEETSAQTKIELHEQFAQQKELLIDAVESKVNDFLLQEMATLKADIKSFRDLEAEKAIEIAKEKTKLGERLAKDMTKLVNKLDTFLEMRITSEFDVLKEDILEAKKLEFGKKIFEAFLPEYRKYFVDPNETEAALNEAKIKIDKLSSKYKNVKKEKEALYRKVKLEGVLSPLTGRHRDLMESILSSVGTEKLEDAYKLYINKVLKESTDKPTKVIKESAAPAQEAPVTETVVITGDDETHVVTEAVVDDLADTKSYFMKLAGIVWFAT